MRTRHRSSEAAAGVPDEVSNLGEKILQTLGLVGPSDLSALHTVRSKDGKRRGTVTRSFRRCQLDGCGGLRIRVRWSDGRVTWPCSAGMTFSRAGGVGRIV